MLFLNDRLNSNGECTAGYKTVLRIEQAFQL